jgi:3D (Asp-Asp-Asp) domain-containing protein
MMPKFEKMVLFLITICFFTIVITNHFTNNKIDEVTMQAYEVARRVDEVELVIEEIKTEEVEEEIEEVEEELNLISLGEFKLTAYCSCSKCCGKWANNRPLDEYGNEIVIGSIGERLTAGYSIAVDPNVIPYKTEVIINGITYKAQDCGGGIKNNDIDVYFDNHEDALDFGVQYAEVFKIEQ